MPDQDVKRCPFCGGAAAVSINHSVTKNAYYTRVKCLGCGGQGRTFKSGENPENDSEKLFTLQYKYLKNGDETARKELYLLSYEIMRRLLWRRMKKGGLGWLDEERQNEIVADAFWYVFRRYERGVGYVVTKSFISVLKNGVKHALEYTTMKDEEVSLTGIKNITNKAKRIFC